jgi:hypothetical protein
MHQIMLDSNQNLVVYQGRTENWLSFAPWVGGWFCFLYFTAFIWFHLTMNWLTYLDIIVRLFKVDPAKGQTPRDPYAVEKASAKNLITMAQRRLKERKPVTSGACQLCLLNTEAGIKKILTCQTNKFGRILNQGRSQIRRELNLFTFLKQQREIQATLDAIVPFANRRILKR